ncbi:MAG: family 43 glycosylhydrolase [Chthoniobacteraceae bacterium]
MKLRLLPTSVLACALLLGTFISLTPQASALDDGPGRWPVTKAQEWLTNKGWLRGCNFTPSTAINQLEMWQAETWDEATIDRELGWAEDLGFNSVRVYLHDLAWKQDPEGFLDRVDRFLVIADKHGISTLFTIFDSCWHPLPKVGPQPAPIPHTHNSGWVQSPGVAVLQHPEQQGYLRDYVHAVVKRFANDPRIDGWDVWNEPENGDGGAPGRPGLEPANKVELMLPLLEKAFVWAREANPSQPLTSAPWLGDWSSDDKLSPTQRIQLANSDVISFHNYAGIDELRRAVESLRRFDRPLLCTEFMARPRGSTFDPNLAYLKEQKVAAYCWGSVSGKTQTIYPWDSWKKKYEAEPPLWFHDILRADGTPYCPEEAAYIRRVTGAPAAQAKSAASPGTYHNPVLRGDYPDPSVIRVGNDYYATATASEWAPQFPILHSKDLVNWQIVGSVFPEPPQWATANFWAPELQHWKGKYYVYYTGRKKGGPLALAVATADKPEGPWTDHGPLVAQDAGSIDGMAIDDEKGQRWLVWKEDGNSRKKPTPIWAQRLDTTGTKLTGEPRELLRNDQPWEGPLIEGPFVLRRGDWFYLFYAGNACCGRGCNYGEGVARAKSLLGPWEKNPNNPILKTNEHFRGPGHGSIVEDPDGRVFLLYHAYTLPTVIYTGREMMLDEITFNADGWPVINEGRGPSSTAPLPTGAAQSRAELAFLDEFDEGKLRLGWQWPVGTVPNIRFDAIDGGRLIVKPPTTGTAGPLGTVLARACTSGDYTAMTALNTETLSEGATAGLSAFGDPANALGITVGKDRATLWRVEKGERTELAHHDGLRAGPTQIRMTASDGHRFKFAVSSDGKTWTTIGDHAEGDYLPPWDRNIRIALIANGDDIRFDSFRIEPKTKPEKPL